MAKDFLISTKKIYDSIHGFIKFDEIERRFIDSISFQRLHYIRQLGVTYLVYPGATHTRFEHSLGVMELATSIYKKICSNVRPDIFHLVPRKGSADYRYWKKILRIAAICHDLGHLPFSHVAEKKLFAKQGHEAWTLKIIQSSSLDIIFKKLSQRPGFQERNIKEDVIKIALGEEKLKFLKQNVQFSPFEKIVSQIITTDFFGADRIDYLLRDSKATGVNYGLFDYLQLIESIRILPGKKLDDLALGIDENGLESCEALLLARHFMHKRVYQHPSVKAFNFHLSRFMKIQYEKNIHDLDNFLKLTDEEVICSLNKAANDKSDKGYFDAVKIIFRKDHFKAIALSDHITNQELEKFKSQNKIKDEEIAWEINTNTELKKDLSFLICKKNLSIDKASNCSSLLVNIPTDIKNWLYILPKYEILFFNYFKK